MKNYIIVKELKEAQMDVSLEIRVSLTANEANTPEEPYYAIVMAYGKLDVLLGAIPLKMLLRNV